MTDIVFSSLFRGNLNFVVYPPNNVGVEISYGLIDQLDPLLAHNSTSPL